MSLLGSFTHELIIILFDWGCPVSCFTSDNEHIFLDMEDKLTKYFPKEWKQDSGKVRVLQ